LRAHTTSLRDAIGDRDVVARAHDAIGDHDVVAWMMRLGIEYRCRAHDVVVRARRRRTTTGSRSIGRSFPQVPTPSTAVDDGLPPPATTSA